MFTLLTIYQIYKCRNYSIRGVKAFQVIGYVTDVFLVLCAFKFGSLAFRIVTVVNAILEVGIFIGLIVVSLTSMKSECEEHFEKFRDAMINDGIIDDMYK